MLLQLYYVDIRTAGQQLYMRAAAGRLALKKGRFKCQDSGEVAESAKKEKEGRRKKKEKSHQGGEAGFFAASVLLLFSLLRGF